MLLIWINSLFSRVYYFKKCLGIREEVWSKILKFNPLRIFRYDENIYFAGIKLFQKLLLYKDLKTKQNARALPKL